MVGELTNDQLLHELNALDPLIRLRMVDGQSVQGAAAIDGGWQCRACSAPFEWGPVDSGPCPNCGAPDRGWITTALRPLPDHREEWPRFLSAVRAEVVALREQCWATRNARIRRRLAQRLAAAVADRDTLNRPQWMRRHSIVSSRYVGQFALDDGSLILGTDDEIWARAVVSAARWEQLHGHEGSQPETGFWATEEIEVTVDDLH